MDFKKTPLIVVLCLFVLSFALGVGAAVGLSYTDTISVSYGEVEYVQSDIVVTDTEIVGPGINVHEIEATVEAGDSSHNDSEIEIYLMDSDVEVSSGTETFSIDSGETKTVVVDVDDVRETEFEKIDVRLVE